MKDYIDIAKQYFKALEGLHLYPPLKSAWSLAWMIMLAVWAASIAWYFGSHAPDTRPGFWIVLIPEIIWLLITFRIQTLRQQRLVTDTNRRFGTSFSSSEECRRHLLTALLKRPPSSFLSVGKEIDDLMLLQRKFRKHSDLSVSELGRKIYDRDSKSRLLTLLVVPVSMAVALIAKSDTTLDTLFEVYSDPGVRSLLAFLAVAAAVIFALVVGLQTLFWTIMDGLASWSTKLLGTSQRWALGYLVRDLAHYHCPTDSTKDAGNDVAATIKASGSSSLITDEGRAPQPLSPLSHRPVEGLATTHWTNPYVGVKYGPYCYPSLPTLLDA